ncbi:MAG: hypothetical protein KDB57_06625 [Solirubrobacterales bacterium]|nr:hypothetical protein [Solirubrobacterales bacterium]
MATVADAMDGVSDDFSGLPEYKSRSERRDERVERIWAERRNSPYRGRRTKLILVGGFTLAVLLLALALIILFAPTPYLGASHGALANSVGGSSVDDCRPSGSTWICTTTSNGTVERYDVKVDWAGCWSGELIGAPASSDTDRKISGCVSIIDHLRAG